MKINCAAIAHNGRRRCESLARNITQPSKKATAFAGALMSEAALVSLFDFHALADGPEDRGQSKLACPHLFVLHRQRPLRVDVTGSIAVIRLRGRARAQPEPRRRPGQADRYQNQIAAKITGDSSAYAPITRLSLFARSSRR